MNLSKTEIVRLFADPISDYKKYVMGISRDGYAHLVNEYYLLDGFIDDFSTLENHLGVPVLRSSDVPPNSIIVVCSTVRTYDAVQSLKDREFNNVISYPEFYLLANNDRLKLRIFENFANCYKKNVSKFDSLRNRLGDEQSKQIFDTLVQYRLSADIELMKGFKFDPLGQYFDPVVKLDGDTFVDGGGFDGVTSLEFIKHCPNYKKIFFFEPSSANMEIAKNNLKTFPNVNYLEYGLSNDRQRLYFDTTSGSASKVVEISDCSIVLDAVDNLINDEVSFIKIDIEGFEMNALQGMANHIKNDHPKLAIAVYHKPEDLWELPEYVLSIRSDYNLYLRHYTQGTDETILYFIPKDNGAN
ncbi:MAG: FkbM family methyltransferase [Pararheinheimera sp.]|nr:FkbM family methyltransferase [Rheinheimera sp.]